MATDVTTLYAQQFTDLINVLAQQMDSRLADKAMQGTHTGSKQAAAVDQIGLFSAKVRTTRYATVSFDDPLHYRRWVFPTPYENNVPFDNIDKLQMLGDPRAQYGEGLMAAYRRRKDDLFIAATVGDAKTGETGGTTTSFTSGNSISQSTGASGNVDLNVAKIRAGKKILMKNEVMLDSDPIYIAVNADAHDSLLAEVQVVSTDFNNAGSKDVPVLKEGKVERFLGIQFIHSERLILNPTYTSVPMWAKSGMHWGNWADIATRIDQRLDLEGAPWQVKVTAMFGATRTEETKVVELLCYQSAYVAPAN